ncbi:hypothetical protein LTR54_017740 [Friedmanniomyces endolithicus]|uniref:Uncharacterized protein n=1 Tax=Friedmanniomyces endolithicus TaxID=329885 RepID=A0AAN6F3X8_9PEZI|nr:hypothetical protein LTR82_017842 [Friedmanniomyces endolithicus]KAK0971667.1 hypothetical protein LTR54_017740 [Friedmanniomyces endolithicus]
MALSCRRLYYLLRKYLLQHNIRYSKGSALIWAAKRDQRNFARRLLRLGAEVDTRGKPRRNGTALHHAAAAGHFGMAELLLKNGGYAEVCGAHGFKPLLLALLARHEEIAILLFRKMGDPDSQIAGEAGYTSLHAACLRQLPKSARVFLKSGANVNVRTSKRNTPLHLALKREASDESNNSIRTCTLELAMLLLEFGSDRDTKAHVLGLQHPDPRVRGIFQEHGSSSPQRAAFISIGRCWSVQDSSNFDCFFSPVSATFSPSWNRQSANASEKDNLPTIVAENLFDDEVFPVLGFSRLWQEQEPSTSAWIPSKVKKIIETMLVDDSTEGEILSMGLPADPFPQLIGRRSPHPLESAAKLSWRVLGNAETQYVVDGKRNTSKESRPQPDVYYWALPSQIDPLVRRDLAGQIVASRRTDLPAAPNFSFEGKGASGRPDVAQRQAMNNGAYGARGMLGLQNYGNTSRVYDGNAYTVSAAYHPGTGTMQMYTTHPVPALAQPAGTEYYMTQLRAFAVTDSADSFRQGAAAYRNARAWTQEQRDQFIANANAAAGTSTRNRCSSTSNSTRTTSTGSSIGLPPQAISDTSADELAGPVTPIREEGFT